MNSMTGHMNTRMGMMQNMSGMGGVMSGEQNSTVPYHPGRSWQFSKIGRAHKKWSEISA